MKPITKLKALFSKASGPTFDRERLSPVIRESICTGEQTAGFRERTSGRFHEVMLIRSDADLAQFCKAYGISPEEIETVY